MPFRNNELLNYWQRRYIAYCLNPNVDWTKPEVQRTWESFGKYVGRFLSEEYPLTQYELDILCQVYDVQHGDPHDKPHDKPSMRYSLSYQLEELFRSDIVLMVEWWPFKY